MTTALVSSHQAQMLAEKPKSELIHDVLRFKNSIAKKKQEIKHAGQMAFGSVIAAAGGATAGVLAAKLPLIPRTKIPTDVALGVAISLGCALDVFDGADPYINDFAKGLIGAGVKDLVLAAMKK